MLGSRSPTKRRSDLKSPPSPTGRNMTLNPFHLTPHKHRQRQSLWVGISTWNNPSFSWPLGLCLKSLISRHAFSYICAGEKDTGNSQSKGRDRYCQRSRTYHIGTTHGENLKAECTVEWVEWPPHMGGETLQLCSSPAPTLCCQQLNLGGLFLSTGVVGTGTDIARALSSWRRRRTRHFRF